MALDPVFWDVVEAESNAHMPLSFRDQGAWACSTPSLLEHEFDEGNDDAAVMAAQVVSWLSDQIRQFSTWTANQFLLNLQQLPRSQPYIATAVTTMLMFREYDKAALVCEDALIMSREISEPTRVLPLSQAVEAHRLIESRGATGKTMVLQVA